MNFIDRTLRKNQTLPSFPYTPHPTPHPPFLTPLSLLLNEGWHLPNLHASYLHLHWGTNPIIPVRFLSCASKHLPTIATVQK